MNKIEKLLEENEQCASEVRSRIDDFVVEKFTLKNCIELQKRSFFADLIVNPLNALWLIPYLSIKKVIEIADKLGFEKFNSFAAMLPSTLPSGFQKKVSRLLVDELFDGKGRKLSEARDKFAENARSEIKIFTTKQAALSDLTSSAITYLVAHQYFGNSSLSIFEIGRKVASLWARDEAASKFFLGESIGRTFYKVAPPPEPSTWQLILATAMLLTIVSLMTTAISAFFPVVQCKLGFLKHNLLKLIDAVEDKTALEIAKQNKRTKAS